MSSVRLLLWLAIVLPQVSYAIDKGYLERLKPDTAEKVLLSFLGPVYYVKGERSGDLVVSVAKKPYTSSAYKYAVLLFLTKEDATGFLQNQLKTAPERLGIAASNLNRILVAQYKTIGKPISDDDKKPDLIIVDTLLPLVPLVEAFVTNQQQPYVHELKRKKFIPAFISRTDAIAFEETVKASGGTAFVRRGLDFRSHLKFVETFVDTETPVITFSQDIQWLMNYYVDKLAK